MQSIEKAHVHCKKLSFVLWGQKSNKNKIKNKKKKNTGKMKVLESSLFIQFNMWMLLVRFFKLDALTCTDNQARRASSGGHGKQLSQGGDKFRADLRMAGECVSGVEILHPGRIFCSFRRLLHYNPKMGKSKMLGMQGFTDAFQPPKSYVQCELSKKLCPLFLLDSSGKSLWRI